MWKMILLAAILLVSGCSCEAQKPQPKPNPAPDIHAEKIKELHEIHAANNAKVAELVQQVHDMKKEMVSLRTPSPEVVYPTCIDDH